MGLKRMSRSDAEKAALVQSGARRSPRDWAQIMDDTSPFDVLTLDALSSYTNSDTHEPTVLAIARQWAWMWQDGQDWERDGVSGQAYASISIRKAWMERRLSKDATVPGAPVPGSIGGAMVAYLSVATDQQLLDDLMLDESLSGSTREALYKNRNLPTYSASRYARLLVKKAIEDAPLMPRLDSGFRPAPAAFAEVRELLGEVAVDDVTAAEVVDFTRDWFSGEVDRFGEPLWVSNLTGTDKQPYSRDVQMALLESGKMYRRSALARNPHACGEALTHIAKTIMSNKLPKGAHEHELKNLSLVFKHRNFDPLTAGDAMSRERRKKVKTAIAVPLRSMVIHDLLPALKRNRENPEVRRSKIARIGRAVVALSYVDGAYNDDHQEWFMRQIRAEVTAEEFDAMFQSDDDVVRQFSSLMLVSAALL